LNSSTKQGIVAVSTLRRCP